MTSIKVHGIEYVEKNYPKIIYSNWSPRAFVLGFCSGCALTSIVYLGVGTQEYLKSERFIYLSYL